MKFLDYIIILILAFCFAGSLILTIKNRGKCSGNCEGCGFCTEKEKLKKLFKTNFGICSFSDVSDRLIDCRNKEKLPNNAKSVIMFYFPYKVKDEKPENICRYATVTDYHTVVTKILDGFVNKLTREYPDNKFICFADNSPIPEVYAANRAGLGVIGQNGLLITKEYGGYVFLGEIVTDKYFPPDAPSGECLNCGRCKNVCPVKLDKGICLSKVTQKKGKLTSQEIKLIQTHGCVWGCDICNDVCPLNKNAKRTYIKPFIKSYRNKYEKGEDISGRAYMWRGKGVIDRNYDITENKDEK